VRRDAESMRCPLAASQTGALDCAVRTQSTSSAANASEQSKLAASGQLHRPNNQPIAVYCAKTVRIRLEQFSDAFFPSVNPLRMMINPRHPSDEIRRLQSHSQGGSLFGGASKRTESRIRTRIQSANTKPGSNPPGLQPQWALSRIGPDRGLRQQL